MPEKLDDRTPEEIKAGVAVSLREAVSLFSLVPPIKQTFVYEVLNYLIKVIENEPVASFDFKLQASPQNLFEGFVNYILENDSITIKERLLKVGLIKLNLIIQTRVRALSQTGQTMKLDLDVAVDELVKIMQMPDEWQPETS